MKISNELKAEIQEMVKGCQNTISLDDLNSEEFRQSLKDLDEE